jgi:integrase
MDKYTSERQAVIDLYRKHGLRARHIPIHPDLYAMLREWHQGADSAYIVSYRGHRLTRIQDGFRRAVRRAGLSGITPYSLRHAFATHSLLSTGNLRAVSSILGHSSPRITAEVYTATSGEIERAVVDRMPSVTHTSHNATNIATDCK